MGNLPRCGRSPSRNLAFARPEAASFLSQTFGRIIAAMTDRTTELLQKALAFSEKERADLACSLLDSLDTSVDEGVEAAWDEEIARRIADLDSDKAKTISWEDVQTEISKKLGNEK